MRQAGAVADDETRLVAAVDIDGVVADVRHRLHHLERKPKDWKAFFAAAVNDPSHPVGLQVVQRLALDHEVVFLTGRPRNLERDTMRWLEQNGLGGHTLLMRPDRDRRPAAVVKVETLLRLYGVDGVVLVVDDDLDVLQAMKRAGFNTFHADWEARAAADEQSLREAQEHDGRT
jgi:hypothetical protein